MNYNTYEQNINIQSLSKVISKLQGFDPLETDSVRFYWDENSGLVDVTDSTDSMCFSYAEVDPLNTDASKAHVFFCSMDSLVPLDTSDEEQVIFLLIEHKLKDLKLAIQRTKERVEYSYGYIDALKAIEVSTPDMKVRPVYNLYAHIPVDMAISESKATLAKLEASIPQMSSEYEFITDQLEADHIFIS